MEKEIKFYNEYLPIKLVNNLNHLLSRTRDYRTKDNLILIVGTLFHKQINEYGDLYSYVPTGSSYWKQLIHSDYKKPIDNLLLYNIIQTYEYNRWTKENHHKGSVHKYYRVNPDLLDGEKYTYVQYNSIPKNGFNGELANTKNNESFVIEPLSKKKMRVSTFKKEAFKYLNNNIDKLIYTHFNFINLSEMPDDLYLNYKWFRQNKGYEKRHAKVSTIKLLAQTNNQSFFYYKDSYFLGNTSTFLTNKKKTLINYYKQVITRINQTDSKLLNFKSKKTGRIFNHLVNCPSDLLNIIRINEKPIIQIDLKTSQFLLFANIINQYLHNGKVQLLKSFTNGSSRTFINRLIKIFNVYKDQIPTIDHNTQSTVINFISDVFSGDFYEIIQNDCNLLTRQLAKDAVFSTIFGKMTAKDDFLINKLHEKYPIIIDIIKDFKDKYGYQEFSIGLQAIEAHIFISKIFKPLRKKGIPCFSRHDSIVVQYGYEKETFEFMIKTFNQLKFKHNFKIDYLLWEGVDDINEIINSKITQNMNYIFNLNYGITKSLIDNEQSEEPTGEELDLILNFCEMGVCDDYSDKFVNAEHLQDVLLLPNLTNKQKEVIEQEVVNYMSGHTTMQPETNKVLKRVFAEIIDKY